MPEKLKEQTIQEIEFKVIYSSRRTLGISILPDSTVVVRVPYRTSDKTINRIVQEKASWIIKHRDGITRQNNNKLNRRYVNGENHLFRGYEFKLSIEKSNKSYFRVNCGVIEIGLINPDERRQFHHHVARRGGRRYSDRCGAGFQRRRNGPDDNRFG
jgi:predicted metal-dependent hydrolase